MKVQKFVLNVLSEFLYEKFSNEFLYSFELIFLNKQTKIYRYDIKKREHSGQTGWVSIVRMDRFLHDVHLIGCDFAA